jgi:hypothetical protein
MSGLWLERHGNEEGRVNTPDSDFTTSERAARVPMLVLVPSYSSTNDDGLATSRVFVETRPFSENVVYTQVSVSKSMYLRKQTRAHDTSPRWLDLMVAHQTNYVGLKDIVFEL